MKDERISPTGGWISSTQREPSGAQGDVAPAPRWAGALHGLAGLLLVLFALSHEAFLTVGDARLGMRNPVFPFLSYGGVSLLAGLLELGLGMICLRWRGRPWVNWLILTLVAILLWYRWAFRYTGGVGCNCLALLGKLLGVNRTQETALSWFVLLVLVLTTFPWLLGLARRAWHARTGLIPALVLLGFSHVLRADVPLRVWGTVSLQEFNPRTGEPYPQQQWHNTFIVIRTDQTWDLQVTNQHHSHWWGRQAFDGTNCYALRPAGGVFVAGSPNQPSKHLAAATVIRAPYPVPLSAGVLGEALVSLTYCWSPATFNTNPAGAVVLPIPWTVVRNNPNAWGYRWVVRGWQDGRFLRSCEVVRDSSLDEPTKQELFRWEIDYPKTVADYNAYLNELSHRRSLPDGTVRGRYSVTQWFQTNGWTFPRTSRLEVFAATPTNWPARVFELVADGFEWLRDAPEPVPEIVMPTEVNDYRYKRWNARRVFRYARYTLEAGDRWPGGQEPALLAAAEDWLKRGRPYSRFAEESRRWLAWSVLGLLVCPVVILGIKKLRKTNPQKGETL